MAPKDIQVPFSRTCEYITLHGKKDFVDYKDLEMKALNIITSVLVKKEAERFVYRRGKANVIKEADQSNVL